MLLALGKTPPSQARSGEEANLPLEHGMFGHYVQRERWKNWNMRWKGIAGTFYNVYIKSRNVRVVYPVFLRLTQVVRNVNMHVER